MKKIFFALILFCSGIWVNALEISEDFTYNNNFWKNGVSISQSINYAMNIGLDFDLTEHKDIKNHIYTFSLPIMLRGEEFGLSLRPFWIPDNANNASAFGSKLFLTFNINYDDIEQIYSRAFFAVGFAAQDAYLVKTDLSLQKDNFYQLAYDGGVVFDYFNTYFFEIGGNIFEYLSGISSVESFGGVLDQQNIASLDTLNYVLNLPKGSAGIKITWNSKESMSENSLSYRFIEFYDKDISAHHSLKFSSKIALNSNFFVGLAYNHIFISGQKDKDIFKGAISFRL